MSLLLTVNNEIQRLWTARENVKKMLGVHRQHQVLDDAFHDIETFLSAFEQHGYAAATIRAFKRDTRELILVFFPEIPKLNVQSVTSMCSTAKETNCHHFIIVYREQITSSSAKRIEDNIQIEGFSQAELQFDILDHELVPKHTILSPQDGEAVQRRFRVEKKKQMAKILAKDPIARRLGALPSDVIEIRRPSMEGFYYNEYRIVKA